MSNTKNYLREKWENRYEKLPLDVKQKLDSLKSKRQMTDELIVIDKTRPKLKDGDVFIVQPVKDLYFYGRVLKANVKHICPDSWFKCAHVIVIFNVKSSNKILDPNNINFNYNDVLVKPSIVISQCWHSGYFHNIGNVPLSIREKSMTIGFCNIDYGRASMNKAEFYNADGTELYEKPDLVGEYALGSFGAIAYEMTIEFIINPKLLDI